MSGKSTTIVAQADHHHHTLFLSTPTAHPSCSSHIGLVSRFPRDASSSSLLSFSPSLSRNFAFSLILFYSIFIIFLPFHFFIFYFPSLFIDWLLGSFPRPSLLESRLSLPLSSLISFLLSRSLSSHIFLSLPLPLFVFLDVASQVLLACVFRSLFDSSSHSICVGVFRPEVPVYPYFPRANITRDSFFIPYTHSSASHRGLPVVTLLIPGADGTLLYLNLAECTYLRQHTCMSLPPIHRYTSAHPPSQSPWTQHTWPNLNRRLHTTPRRIRNKDPSISRVIPRTCSNTTGRCNSSPCNNSNSTAFPTSNPSIPLSPS